MSSENSNYKLLPSTSTAVCGCGVHADIADIGDGVRRAWCKECWDHCFGGEGRYDSLDYETYRQMLEPLTEEECKAFGIDVVRT